MRARREQVVMGAVAAAVLVALVAFAASSGVRTGEREAQPTPEPTPRNVRDLFGGSLQPGIRYRTRRFVPPLELAVADSEWLVRDASQPHVLTLDRRRRTSAPGSERPPRSFLTFSRVTDLFDPRGRPADVVELTDFEAWLRRHPDLRVGRGALATIAGVSGSEFDVAVEFDRPAIPARECRARLIVCTALGPDRYYTDGTRIRTTILNTQPRLVIEVVGATQRDLDEVGAPAAQVLETLRVGATRP